MDSSLKPQVAPPQAQFKDFFDIRINSVTPDVPIGYDIYLVVSHKPVHFRKRGDIISKSRMKMLQLHGGERFLVPNDQRDVYMQSLKSMIHDPDAATETKSRVIKETAFLHVHDLFTKGDVAPVVSEAKSLVEDMVSFVSTDVNAVASLLRLSTHDYYTYNHSVDVSVYSIVLAKKLFGENPEMLNKAGMAGLLHDIGKRRIDTNIINKAGKLTAEEWEEIKRHPVYGHQFLEEINTIPDESRDAVLEHHENYDGTGYPHKKKGDEICQLARIVTIADVFDALTTDRSYHKASTPAEALDMMFGMQPGKFDPNLFRSFNKNFEKKKSGLKLADDFDPCQPHDLKRALKKA